MTVLVDTIQRELDARRALREHLDQEITTLDRMLQESVGLAQLPAVTRPAPVEEEPMAEVAQLPAAKPKPKPQAKRRSSAPKGLPPARRSQPQPKRVNRDDVIAGQGDEAKAVLAAVQKHHPVGPKKLAEVTGIPRNRLPKVLRLLVEQEKILSRGKTRGLVYTPIGVAAVPPLQPSAEDLAHRVEQEGRQKKPAASLQHQVLGLLAKDPDALTEERLALALDVSRDDIADVCGGLLLEDKVVLNPDHTYRIAGSTTTRQGGVPRP